MMQIPDLKQFDQQQLGRLLIVVGRLMCERENNAMGQNRDMISAKINEEIVIFARGESASAMSELVNKINERYGGTQRRV